MSDLILVNQPFETSVPDFYVKNYTGATSHISNKIINGQYFDGSSHVHEYTLNPSTFRNMIYTPINTYLKWYNLTEKNIAYHSVSIYTILSNIWSIREIKEWIKTNLYNDVLLCFNERESFNNYLINNNEHWNFYFIGGAKEKIKFDYWLNTVRTVYNYVFDKKIYEEQYIKSWLHDNASGKFRITEDGSNISIQIPYYEDILAANFVLIFTPYMIK